MLQAPKFKKEMWVFGYGSLTWKVDFPYEKKLDGFIRGYIRRFYQHSIDHRGIPEKPGRVVTLLPATQNDEVWGVAYYIPPKQEEQVTAHLDYREKDGYRKDIVKFYPSCDSNLEPFDLILYIGTETNQWYAGPAEIDAIARQIVVSKGPSGKNTEYLYNLAATMRRIAPNHNDQHLFDLENEVRRLEESQTKDIN